MNSRWYSDRNEGSQLDEGKDQKKKCVCDYNHSLSFSLKKCGEEMAIARWSTRGTIAKQKSGIVNGSCRPEPLCEGSEGNDETHSKGWTRQWSITDYL